jgi:hypothetical protein
MIKKLTAHVVNKKDWRYFLYTSEGVIKVDTWNYSLPGFVVVDGEDEDKKYRFFVFSEDQMCSFALEIKRKSGSKGTLGFKSDI